MNNGIHFNTAMAMIMISKYFKIFIMKQVENKTINNEEGIFNRSIKCKTLVQFDGQTVQPADYFPVWINNLADDVTLEGSLLNGFVQGPEAVRSIVFCIRKIYDRQEFTFAGYYNEKIFLENYTGWFGDTSVGCLVMAVRNTAGQAQYIAVSYRPVNALQLLSQLVGEQLAGTPVGVHFADKKFESSINNI
jgi:hypothetical protein